MRPRNETVRHVRTMSLAETLYDDAGKALGLLIWNDAERVASFTPRSDGLAALRNLTWPCPIEARRTIKAFALTEKQTS